MEPGDGKRVLIERGANSWLIFDEEKEGCMNIMFAEL